MTKPKITGLLNNCSLYAALPTLLRGIEALAEMNAADKTHQNPIIIKNYDRLKFIFAAYYGINPVDLSWTKFSEFLTPYSFYAREIMFAPILRNFIAEKAPDHGYESDDLWLLRDIQDDGRYSLLTPYDARPLFYQPFGITAEIFEYDARTEQYNHIPNTRDKPLAPYPFGQDESRITLYLKDEHFEIQEHGPDLITATEVFAQEVNALPTELNTIHDLLSSSQTAPETNFALGQLVRHVNKKLIEALYGPNQEFIHAESYVDSGRKFYNETACGKHTFAMILLVLLFEHGNKDAQTFIDLMESLSANPSNEAAVLLNELASKIIEHKANLAALRDIKDRIEQYQIDMSQVLIKSPLTTDETSSMQDLPPLTIDNQTKAPSTKEIVDLEGRDWLGTMRLALEIALFIAQSIFCLALMLAVFAPNTALMVVATVAGAGVAYAGFRFFHADQGVNNASSSMSPTLTVAHSTTIK